MIYFWTLVAAVISCYALSKAFIRYAAAKTYGYFEQKYVLVILFAGSTLVCSLTVLIGLILKELL